MSAPMSEAEKVVAELRRAISMGEDGCGTLLARDPVKVRPQDWHRITRLARQAADLIAQLAARLEEVELKWIEAVGLGAEAQAALTAAEAEVGRLREALQAAEPFVELVHSTTQANDTRKFVWKVLKQIRACLSSKKEG